MEATARDGGLGPWSYREQPGSSSGTISNTSGTVSTTSYTSTGSHLSWISMEAVMLLEEMGEEDTEGFVEPVKKFSKETEVKHTELGRLKGDKEMKVKQIKSLAKELFGAPSARWSIQGAHMSLVLEKWFKKMGVGWVLRFANAAAARKLEQTLDVSSWIRALAEIRHALFVTASLFSVHGSVKEEEEEGLTESGEQDIMTDQVQIAKFAQQAIFKMLAFVDFIDVPNLNITCQVSTIHQVAPDQKLDAMLHVYSALSTGWSSHSSASAQVRMIQAIVVDLLSAKKRKAGEAIWNTMEEIRDRILESVHDGDDSSGTQPPQGSPGIHKATRSVLSYIRFLKGNSTSICPIMSEAARLGKYVPQMRCEGYLLYSLNVEMLHCVQEKLVKKSEKFTDQSLRFIFLLNNLSFIGDLLDRTSYFPISYNAVHTGKVKGYMERYIQVSWAPVLACLFNPKPFRLFWKTYCPLLKFESEFQKTYTTQKLWKVTDPELRKNLRKAIIVKMVPSYTKYLEDSKVITPKFTPRDLEEMLQELFEG